MIWLQFITFPLRKDENPPPVAIFVYRMMTVSSFKSSLKNITKYSLQTRAHVRSTTQMMTFQKKESYLSRNRSPEESSLLKAINHLNQDSGH